MKFNKLSIKDKKIFSKYLSLTKHEPSVYAFENIYIWKELFDIRWVNIQGALCVFFKDKTGCFLYIPPQGLNLSPKIIERTFIIMDKFNKNKDISRIENVEEKDLTFYQDLGYECVFKSCDYLCRREDLVGLKGNRFKSKRAGYNYFIKHYQFKYLPFSLRYRDDCLKLYDHWMKERKGQNQDSLYQGMLQDSRVCLEVLLDNYSDLDFMGRLVRIDNRIKAFSFGFKLNKDTSCILYEITDLSIKGLAQFIFRKFSSELKDFKFINIMDDSGLGSLKRVKFSYHPTRLIPTYIVKRKNG